jgi:DNA replication and repair protein RecF
MFIRQIKVNNFKSHSQTQVAFDFGINLILGKNGVGKTSLIDAVHVLALGKSYFTGRESNCIAHGSEFYRIEGIFERDDHVEMVSVRLAGNNKRIERDGIHIKTILDHVGRYPCTVIAPSDTELITGGSEVRRRFIDQVICQTDRRYLDCLLKYNKILKTRNTFLKSFYDSGKLDADLLKGIDNQLVPAGNYIHEKRKSFVETFCEIYAEHHYIISGNLETVRLDYLSQLSDGSFGDLLDLSSKKDFYSQRTSVGIHKDDLRIFLNESTLNTIASQGQLKTSTLALKIAQYHYLKSQFDFKPMLLLDDIFDKLDPDRIKSLLELLFEIEVFGQVFITDTFSNRLLDLLPNRTNKSVSIFEFDGNSINKRQAM